MSEKPIGSGTKEKIKKARSRLWKAKDPYVRKTKDGIGEVQAHRQRYHSSDSSGKSRFSNPRRPALHSDQSRRLIYLEESNAEAMLTQLRKNLKPHGLAVVFRDFNDELDYFRRLPNISEVTYSSCLVFEIKSDYDASPASPLSSDIVPIDVSYNSFMDTVNKQLSRNGFCLAEAPRLSELSKESSIHFYIIHKPGRVPPFSELEEIEDQFIRSRGNWKITSHMEEI